MSAVAVIGLHMPAGLKKVVQNFIEDFYIGGLTRGVRALDLHQVPPQNADAELVFERGLSCELVGVQRKCIPLLRQSLLGGSRSWSHQLSSGSCCPCYSKHLSKSILRGGAAVGVRAG
jgi:hypothetical protein